MPISLAATRTVLPPISRPLAVSLLFAALFGASGALAAGAPLAAHRVVYDLTLGKSTGNRGVESARGRIVFDFLGDNCEGYALNYRQVTILDSAETGSRTSDLRTTTFEAGDGSSLRFKTESRMEGRLASDIDGQAERGASGLAIDLKKPKPDKFAVAGEAVFPSDHMKRLIEAGRAGERTLNLRVYDASDDGRKVYETLAVIGARIVGGTSENVEGPLRKEPMTGLARWPVTLSYFTSGQGERTPIYVISFELYENGVSRALKLDYGSFALQGQVASFELMPASACAK